MRIIGIEHADDFTESVVVFFELYGVSKEIAEIGKKIDGENYIESCFGFCMVHDREDNSYSIVDEYDKQLYYVDNSGRKNYIDDFKIPEAVIADAISRIKNGMKDNSLF